MRTLAYCAVAAGLAVSLVACGSKTPEPSAQKPASEKTAAQQAQDMAKGFEAMAKSVEAANKAGEKPVDPVAFGDLQTLLPDMSGWEKGKPEGEKMTSPVAFSQAKVDYTKGEANIESKIVDSGFNQMLVAPFAMFLTANYEKQTSTGYEKAVKVGEFPGWEKWDKGSKNGELHTVVGNRFIVSLEGRGIDDTQVLWELARKIDMRKLASLK
jgi:hypothetical protein